MKYKKRGRQERALARVEKDINLYSKKVKLDKTDTEAKTKLKKAIKVRDNTKRNLNIT